MRTLCLLLILGLHFPVAAEAQSQYDQERGWSLGLTSISLFRHEAFSLGVLTGYRIGNGLDVSMDLLVARTPGVAPLIVPAHSAENIVFRASDLPYRYSNFYHRSDDFLFVSVAPSLGHMARLGDGSLGLSSVLRLELTAATHLPASGHRDLEIDHYGAAAEAMLFKAIGQEVQFHPAFGIFVQQGRVEQVGWPFFIGDERFIEQEAAGLLNRLPFAFRFFGDCWFVFETDVRYPFGEP